MSYIPLGHRRRGAGLTSDQIPDLQKAIALAQLRGRTIYVDSVVAATLSGATGNGDSWASPFSTTAAAVAAAVSDDLILVAPGHAETISTAGGLTLSKTGVTVLGLGHGNRRPVYTMSAVAASVIISGAEARLINCRFATTAACTIVIDINTVGVVVAGCVFDRTSGTVPVVWIDINGGAANACDRVQVLDCRVNSGTNAGATGFIELGEVADGVLVDGCTAFGDFSDACIHNPIGKVLTNLQISNCILTNLNTGDHSIELVSACTGNLIYNLYHNDMTQQTGVDPGSCFSFQCFQDDVIDTSAILTPVIT